MIGDILNKALEIFDISDILSLTDKVVGIVQDNRLIELGGSRVELEKYRNLHDLLNAGMATKRDAQLDVASGRLVTDRYSRDDRRDDS